MPVVYVCAGCNSEFHYGNYKCPTCQAEGMIRSVHRPEKPSSSKEKPQPPSNQSNAGAGCVAAIIVVVVLAILNGNDPEEPQKTVSSTAVSPVSTVAAPVAPTTPYTKMPTSPTLIPGATVPRNESEGIPTGDVRPQEPIPWYEECWERVGHPEDKCPPLGRTSEARDTGKEIFGPRPIRFINDCGEPRILGVGLTDEHYGDVDDGLLLRRYEGVFNISEGDELNITVNLQFGDFTWEDLSTSAQLNPDQSRVINLLDTFFGPEYLSLEKVGDTRILRLSCDDR